MVFGLGARADTVRKNDNSGYRGAIDELSEHGSLETHATGLTRIGAIEQLSTPYRVAIEGGSPVTHR